MRAVVVTFYAAVREDPLLGPMFAEHVGDWSTHLDRIHGFWSSVALGSGRYKGNPFGAHLPLRDCLAPEHFERWLSLWTASSREIMGPEASAVLERKAGTIAESLKAGLLFRPGPMAQRADPSPAHQAAPLPPTLQEDHR